MALTTHMIITRTKIHSGDAIAQLIELGDAAVNDDGTVIKAKVCRDVMQSHIIRLLINLGVFVPGDIEPVGLNPGSEDSEHLTTDGSLKR